MRPVADVQPALDVHAVLHEAVDLVEQRVRIEDDSIPDGAANTRVQDPARNLMQHEMRRAQVHRMAGIRAALIPNHPRGALGEHIHELALPFVAPLGADDDYGAARITEHGG